MTTKLNQPPSELYQSNLLQTAIFLASYLETLDAKTFAEVDKKIMLVFLGSKFEDGKWVLRERDIEDRRLLPLTITWDFAEFSIDGFSIKIRRETNG